MKTLNPVDKEALCVGGSYLLSPVLSIAVALPIYFWTQHVVAALTAGSLAGIGLYIYSCIRSPDGSSAARAAEEYNLQMEKKMEKEKETVQ